MPIDLRSPLFEGVMQGHAILQNLRAEADAQRQAAMQERQMEADDLKNRMLLESVSRPVTGGTVRDIVPRDAFPEAGMMDIPYQRKPDASRTVNFRTASGETLQRELMTPEEQASRSLSTRLAEAKAMQGVNLDQVRKAAGIQEDVAMEKERQRRKEFGTVPPAEWGIGTTPLLPSEYAEAGQLYQRTHALPAKPTEHVITDDSGNVSVLTMQGGKPSVIRAGRIGKSREARNSGLTPYQQSQAAHQAQVDLEKATKQHDDLQEKEQEQHGFREAYGQALNTAEGESFIDPDSGKETKMNGLIRSSLKRRYEMATKKVADLQERQKKIRQRFGGEAPTPATAGGGQQGVAGAVQPGATVTLKNGKQVVVKKVNADGTFEY